MRTILISPYPDIRAFGIRTLSACLKREEGCDVQLVFLPKPIAARYNDRTLNEIVKLSKSADLIGISLMTNFFEDAVQITQSLKKNSSIPVMWGGIHPTVRPAECLDYADMVCIGESEQMLVELVRNIRDGKDFHNVQGIWFEDKGKIVRNELRPLIQDLDSIPFPDYDYEAHYTLSHGRIRRMDKDLLKAQMGVVYANYPSRGCPYGCTYCCNNTLNKMYCNPRVRRQSVDYIIKELITIKSKLPFIERIRLDSDSFFTYTNEEIIDFARKYKKNIGLPFVVTGITPSSLTRENLLTLVDAGLKYVRMGIQTGAERTKRLYKRYHSNQQVEKTIRLIHEFKDKIKLPGYDVILDNPWETEDDLIETLMFLSRLPTPYKLFLFSLTFFPGTELYEKAKRDGIVKDDLKDVYRKGYLYCKKTYLNKLFFLLGEYAERGGCISPKTMAFLTNRKLRQLRLSWLIYMVLKVRNTPTAIRYLLCEGLKDIRKGEWFRIINYMKKELHFKQRKVIPFHKLR